MVRPRNYHALALLFCFLTLLMQVSGQISNEPECTLKRPCPRGQCCAGQLEPKLKPGVNRLEVYPERDLTFNLVHQKCCDANKIPLHLNCSNSECKCAKVMASCMRQSLLYALVRYATEKKEDVRPVNVQAKVKFLRDPYRDLEIRHAAMCDLASRTNVKPHHPRGGRYTLYLSHGIRAKPLLDCEPRKGKEKTVK